MMQALGRRYVRYLTTDISVRERCGKSVLNHVSLMQKTIYLLVCVI